MTITPGLIQLPLTSSGRPTAATTRSARRTTAGRSRVREWAIVTVQLSLSSSCATGLPTMLERPMTTASSPSSFGSTDLARIEQPVGVHGASALAPLARRPMFTG